MGENARNRTVVTGILLLYHKIMKKKTLFSKRCKFFHVNCRQKSINFCGSFCAFLQKSEKLKKIFGICNFFYSRIVSIVKGFFAAFAVQTVVCSSVFPLSREKGRCEGGLHCAVRGPIQKGQAGNTGSGMEENRNILAGHRQNNAECRFSPMLFSAFLFAVDLKDDKRWVASHFLIFYDKFTIGSFGAVVIILSQWYNEKKMQRKIALFAE